MARGKNEQSGSVDMQNNLTHVKDMSNDIPKWTKKPTKECKHNSEVPL